MSIFKGVEHLKEDKLMCAIATRLLTLRRIAAICDSDDSFISFIVEGNKDVVHIRFYFSSHFNIQRLYYFEGKFSKCYASAAGGVVVEYFGHRCHKFKSN